MDVDFDQTEKYVEEDNPVRRQPTLGEAFISLKSETQGAITALGGWTAPAETTYDLLPEIRANRGGIQYGAIDLADAHLVREVDETEAEPVPVNLPAWLDPDGVREMRGAFHDPGRIAVGISVGDQPLTLIGSVQPNPLALARLLRMVADRLEP